MKESEALAKDLRFVVSLDAEALLRMQFTEARLKARKGDIFFHETASLSVLTP
jgi:hypothetical protein